METIILIFLVFLVLATLVAILNTLRKVLPELKNLRIRGPQKIELPKIEFPKIEFPKVEIPPAKEYALDLNPIAKSIDKAVSDIKKAVAESSPKETMGVELMQNLVATQSDLIKILQETSALMRVNQAEFQSGLEAFHKAIEKLLTQIPTGDKELSTQKEFIQKFEEAFVKVQEKSTEAMNENSLRLQEILTEVLNKEAK
jgi:hypothetical protein